jgi:transcriptional regulator with XRE-family HTH domain
MWTSADRACTITDVDDTDRTGSERLVTVNQVVARNLARYRNKAGLTQKELGDRLGWTKNKVSEAERSFDGERTREFDAQELAHLSLALDVPLIALLLPPEDDGMPVAYNFTGPDGKPCSMADLTGRVLLPDSGDDGPALEDYRDRFRAAVARYLDPEWAEEVARWLGHADDPAVMALRAAQLRERQRDMLRAAAEFGSLADVIESQGGSR